MSRTDDRTKTTSNKLELMAYSLLNTGEGKTLPEIAELMGINRTNAYHLLFSLQDKNMIAAIPGKPIRFTALKSSRPNIARTSRFRL